jgi:hypothetical protein
MGQGSLNSLPENIDEQTAAAFLGPKFNPTRWQEIVSSDGTIKLSKLKDECNMRHSYPPNSLPNSPFTSVTEPVDPPALNLEEEKNRVDEQKDTEPHATRHNYPPNHPKGRSNKLITSVTLEGSTATETDE